MNQHYKSVTVIERTVHTMFGTLIVLAVLYCAVLLSVVFSVIERKQNTIVSRELTSSLASLEASYANRVSSISDAALSARGFKRVDGTTFAVRKDPIASYTVLYAR